MIEVGWLNKHGHQAWVACDPRSEICRRGRELGVAVLPASMRSNADLMGLQALWRFCRREKTDVIHTHGPKDSWLCLPFYALGHPVVRSRHTTVAIGSDFRHTFIYRFGCSRVIATAETIRDALVSRNGVPSARVDVVGEGVDLQEYHPAVDGSGIRREFGIQPEASLIGNIAMMRGDKGHHFFLDAALEVLKTHPHARFLLVGEGIGGRRVEHELRSRIETAGEQKRIIMTGYRWDIPQIVAALDLVVIASIGVEAQSRIVPQAFASRRAVIATRVGGIPELVGDGANGLIVPPGDGQAIAAAIRLLIDQPEQRARLAAAGYATARERLSLDRMMQETLATYEKAIGR